MVRRRAAKVLKKRPGRYHHGDLRRALVEEALRTIETQGVEGLTLRAVGEALGVSRTALYRHFADKSALLAQVAEEGFRTLRARMGDAWEQGGRGREGFEAMSVAYVGFAVTHPAHYRVMFGGSIDPAVTPGLMEEATGAFADLVNAIAEQQRQGLVRNDEPEKLARFIWAVVHGVAMLAISGKLACNQEEMNELMRYSAARIRSGITA